MARAKKTGAAKRRDSDGDFDPKKRSPPKKRASPPKKTTSPRKGPISEQQATSTVDEGIAATPDNSLQQTHPENDDSTYDSSPQKQTATSPPQQTSAGGDTAPSTPSAGAVLAQSSGSWGVASTVARTKIVVLKFAPHKLRQLLELCARPEKKVTLKISRDKLRRFLILQNSVEESLTEQPAQQPEDPAGITAKAMAPVKDNNAHDVLDGHLKDVIHNLYEIGSITHGYLPESQGPLVNKSIELTHSLAALSNLTAENSTHPAAPTIRSILHPPEVIDYVANGRNPDIYTREFVENVQRGNHVLNGKMQAFGSFAEIYARETKSAMPELAEAMDGVMERSGGFERQDGGAGDWKMKKRQVDGS